MTVPCTSSRSRLLAACRIIRPSPGIDANFRPDQVPVTWRDPDEGGASVRVETTDEATLAETADKTVDDAEATVTVIGAEATVTIDGDRVIKRRNPREYRHPTLDTRLRRERTRQEARLTQEARQSGVPTPLIRDIDIDETTLVFQYVGECDLRKTLTEASVETVAEHLARIHEAGFVHGDLTTRNVRVGKGGTPVFFIDFGLGYYTDDPEDYAMDLHIFAQSLAGTTDDAETLMELAEDAYLSAGEETVIDQLREIEGRGRYQ